MSTKVAQQRPNVYESCVRSSRYERKLRGLAISPRIPPPARSHPARTNSRPVRSPRHSPPRRAALQRRAAHQALSELSPTSNELQYQNAAASSGVAQDLNEFGSDYNALANALNTARSKSR